MPLSDFANRSGPSMWLLFGGCEVGIPSGQRTIEESTSTGFQVCNLNSNKVTVFVIEGEATPALAGETMANAVSTDPRVTSCNYISYSRLAMRRG